MLAFNAWYYSFSPPVANSIAASPAAKTTMQGVLYPLVGILSLSAGTFQTASAYPELAIVLAGLLASAMIGAFYLGLPLGVLRGKVRRFRATGMGASLEKTLAVGAAVSIAALLIGEVAQSSLLLMIASSSLVLATILLSATATSNGLARLLDAGRRE